MKIRPLVKKLRLKYRELLRIAARALTVSDLRRRSTMNLNLNF